MNRADVNNGRVNLTNILPPKSFTLYDEILFKGFEKFVIIYLFSIFFFIYSFIFSFSYIK